jgi:hypothetical protein
MVSNYMPSVLVEIAFDSNFATPAASRTWTDVTDYVELHDGIDINFGRQDENATADANQLTLTLDNSDGRFTALRSGSPYYPDVKIGRPIRVKVTPPGGSESVRFVGFIDEWPVEWDGTDAYAKATVRATSRLSRLGLTAKLKSLIEQEILASSPVRYWTLGDPAGSTTASESSGNGGELLTAVPPGIPVVFGNATGPATDGLTAAEFSDAPPPDDGQHLYADIRGAGNCRGMRCAVRITALTGFSQALVLVSSRQVIVVDSTGAVAAGDTSVGGYPQVSGANINDGGTHDVGFIWDATTCSLVVDGVVVDTGSSVGFTSGLSSVRVGNSTVGTLAHVAVWDDSGTAVTTTDLQEQAAAVLNGFAGDTTNERLLRILAWAGVASAEVDAETGVETMTYQQTTDQSVVDALRDVESTEGGVLFDGADGDVKFHNRSHRYLQTPAATLDMAAQHVESDYAPRLDRSTLVNDVTVENPTNGWVARWIDTASWDEYGISTASETSHADDFDSLHQKAEWAVASYAEPRMRCPSLTVDVLAHQGLTPSAQTLLGVTVGDLLALENAPTQSDTTEPSYFVEGYTETIGPESYFITFNLSPSYPAANTFILDDADRGELDAGMVLGY